MSYFGGEKLTEVKPKKVEKEVKVRKNDGYDLPYYYSEQEQDKMREEHGVAVIAIFKGITRREVRNMQRRQRIRCKCMKY